MRARGRDHHADRDADGGQHARGRQHPPDVGEPRRQAALDEDDGQRDRAEMVGEQIVLEMQPEPVLADDDADAEEQAAGWVSRPWWPRAWRRCWPATRARRPAIPDTAAAKSFHPAVNQYGHAWVSMTLCSESDGGPIEASRRADDRQTMRIGIAGAGAIGRSVALELLAYGHKILLIENNVRHYEPHTVPGRGLAAGRRVRAGLARRGGHADCATS